MKERMYYYRPIAMYNGRILKCAGFGAEDPNHRSFYEDYFTRNGNHDGSISPGCIVVSGYRGDRIFADTLLAVDAD